MSRCSRFLLGFSGLLASVVGGCHETSGARPNSVAAGRATQLDALAAAGGAVTVAGAQPHSGSSAAVPSSSVAPVAGAGPLAPVPTINPEDGAGPVLLDDQGKALAQTDERPTLSSAAFQKRMATVAQAILSGEAEPALAAFFPLVAYQQVKDVAKPERDYKFRLLANFKRDLLEYHRALGAAAAESKFLGVTVSEKDARWMAPGSEGNRVGYFRVLRSRLRFTLPTGRTRELELTSMISWRGEWYVVHLHGFK